MVTAANPHKSIHIEMNTVLPNNPTASPFAWRRFDKSAPKTTAITPMHSEEKPNRNAIITFILVIIIPNMSPHAISRTAILLTIFFIY